MGISIKALSLYLQAAFYTIAGVNHFVNPGFYLPLIPDYLPFPDVINTLSGLVEIVLGLGLVFTTTRKIAALGITAMLIAFVPSHVYFIQLGSCVDGGLCVPEWLGWARLIVIHPLLILWALVHRR